MNLLQPLSNNPLHKGCSPKLRKDVREMFEIAQNPNLSVEKKMTNREIGLRKLITQQWQASVFTRILAWMRNGRLGK